MKISPPRFYLRLKDKWAEKWEVIRAKGEQSRFVLMIDDVFTGYDAKSLRIRSLILSALVHFLIILPPAIAVTAYTQSQPQMIEIRFGTAPEADENISTLDPAPVEDVQEEIKPIEFPKDTTDEVEEIKPYPFKDKKPVDKKPKESKQAKSKGVDTGNSKIGEIAAEDYLELLQYSVQEMSSVPAEASDLRGVAVLRLTFDRHGYVRNYKLYKSTGHQILDEAAIQVAERLMREPFPPAPKGFDRNETLLKYDFTIKYPPD